MQLIFYELLSQGKHWNISLKIFKIYIFIVISPKSGKKSTSRPKKSTKKHMCFLKALCTSTVLSCAVFCSLCRSQTAMENWLRRALLKVVVQFPSKEQHLVACYKNFQGYVKSAQTSLCHLMSPLGQVAIGAGLGQSVCVVHSVSRAVWHLWQDIPL